MGYTLSPTTSNQILLFNLTRNNKNVTIGDSVHKLNGNGLRLLENRADVSIEYNRVIVTIHKLQYSDNYQFTVFASGGPFHEIPSIDNTVFTIENVQGNSKECQFYL